MLNFGGLYFRCRRVLNFGGLYFRCRRVLSKAQLAGIQSPDPHVPTGLRIITLTLTLTLMGPQVWGLGWKDLPPMASQSPAVTSRPPSPGSIYRVLEEPGHSSNDNEEVKGLRCSNESHASHTEGGMASSPPCSPANRIKDDRRRRSSSAGSMAGILSDISYV